MAINGTAVAVVFGGAVLAYSGLRGASISGTLKELTQGKSPADAPQSLPISVTVAPPVDQSGATEGSPASALFLTGSSKGATIANDAMRYNNQVMYKFGGGNPSGWDCSGFVNWVLGHDLGYELPGGIQGFNGSNHGPVVPQYATWSHASRVPNSQCQAGDIVLYMPQHMGIAVSNTEVINAYDTGHLTQVMPINLAGPGFLPRLTMRVI